MDRSSSFDQPPRPNVAPPLATVLDDAEAFLTPDLFDDPARASAMFLGSIARSLLVIARCQLHQTARKEGL